MSWIPQFRQYVSDVRSEIRKVVWPTKKETITTTVVVFSMVVLMSLFLWLVDVILSMLVHWIVR
ncbi:MAG: preprotein translocase subunit SecE [Magnetococcales bacterium]|nr:preprotein translocase subunit SecE [Magnetococcales bacterium]